MQEINKHPRNGSCMFVIIFTIGINLFVGWMMYLDYKGDTFIISWLFMASAFMVFIWGTVVGRLALILSLSAKHKPKLHKELQRRIDNGKKLEQAESRLYQIHIIRKENFSCMSKMLGIELGILLISVIFSS